MYRTYHVAKTGSDHGDGSAASPLLTINAAANLAKPGDTVVVHTGEYREWVKPRVGGLSNRRRITYRAAPGERPVIKGSERVQSWENVEGTVWKAKVPNTLFGTYNPFKEIVAGDWMIYPEGRTVHLGDVYLNGKSFYEAESYEGVKNPAGHTEVMDNWTKEMVAVTDAEQTKYTWYANVGDDETTIFANFHGANPNKELTEINVRKCCFYPESTGVDYITVQGFEMAQAAPHWAPPTGDQPGMLGPHWSKGWIIEDNILHDAKCSAISIGKEASTGNQYRTSRRDKPGYQYQLEAVFAARKIGWSKETIGSHLIRNNVIYDCGQNAIVGHMGCVFSEICHNHIYNIALKREFYGHEIAGIKLHAAIDVYIHHNHIHDCSLGTWLDWQAQGTRVSKNLFHHNNRDLFIEISHGPHVVDHNILGSKYALDNHAQGGAYVRNLIAGKIFHLKGLDRATPYHAPHSTEVTGFAMVYGADDRLYQNLFIGGKADAAVGTMGYNGCTTSMEEYMREVDALLPGDLEIFEKVEQPAYISGNAYFSGAEAFEKEEDTLARPGFDTGYAIEQAEDGVYLSITLPEGFDSFLGGLHSTETLGHVRLVDADYEAPDGGPFVLDSDFLDQPLAGKAVAGPLACLKSGENRIRLW